MTVAQRESRSGIWVRLVRAPSTFASGITKEDYDGHLQAISEFIRFMLRLITFASLWTLL